MSKLIRLLFIALPAPFVLEAQITRTLRGEISGGGSPPDGFLVEIVEQSRPVGKTVVMPDGTFELRGLAEGQYEVRVVNFYGDVVWRQFVSVPDNSGQLRLKLRD